jgi:hypothetical protein
MFVIQNGKQNWESINRSYSLHDPSSSPNHTKNTFTGESQEPLR